MTPLEDDEQRAKLDALMEQFRYQIVLYTNRWLTGEVGFQEWRLLFELEVRYLHTIAALIAVGTSDALTPALQRDVRRETELQLQYLNRWMAAARLPTARGSDAYVIARAQLYAGAAAATYSKVRAEFLGLPDLPFYPGDRSACASNCRCYWLILRGERHGDWDCYWMQTAEESCPQCNTRGVVCKPLRVRNGVVQTFEARGTML